MKPISVDSILNAYFIKVDDKYNICLSVKGLMYVKRLSERSLMPGTLR